MLSQTQTDNLKYLKLHFKALFMYFYDNSYPVRSNSQSDYHTCLHPTSQAVKGILGAVLGYDRGSSEMNNLNAAEIDMRCVVLQPGSIRTDFQTQHPFYTQGYTTVDKPKTKTTLYDVDKYDLVRQEGICKHVSYITDAAFDVYVSGTETVLKKYYDAFVNPVYMPYFGKRRCIPAQPIIENTFTIIDGKDLPEGAFNI